MSQLVGYHCEVKSDFDPLTSSIRKEHGDLNGVGSRCRAAWMIFLVDFGCAGR